MPKRLTTQMGSGIMNSRWGIRKKQTEVVTSE